MQLRKQPLAAYRTLDEFCKIYSPSNLLAYTEDERRCFETELAPTLGMLNKRYGKGSAASWLMLMIGVLNEATTSDRRMDMFQIKMAASSIASVYPYLKVTELMLFFRRLLGGAYGRQFFGCVDGPTIGAALCERFLPERARMYDMIEQEKRRREEEDSEGAVYDPERMAAIMERLSRKFGACDGETETGGRA